MMTGPQRLPHCPEHSDQQLTWEGKCPVDGCDYQAPWSGNDNPADISDSDWEDTTEISFEVKVFETAINAPGDSYTPSVTLKVNLPELGTMFTPLPMFRLTGSGMTEHLEKVYRADTVAVVGFYSDETYVRKSLTNDGGKFGTGNPWEELYVEKTELLWDRKWPSTTDPLDDVDLVVGDDGQ